MPACRTKGPVNPSRCDSKKSGTRAAAAFAALERRFAPGFPSAISFITGPSRTAHIERVLTIGVHGPSRFVIIAVDEEPKGGAA